MLCRVEIDYIGSTLSSVWYGRRLYSVLTDIIQYFDGNAYVDSRYLIQDNIIERV